MLTSVYNLRNLVELTLEWHKKEDKAKYALSEEAWEAVEKIAGYLAPARKATTKLQRENLTLGDVFAIWTEMTIGLQKKNSSLAKTLLSAMSERVKAVQYSKKGRCAGEGEKTSPLFHYPAFNAAVFLDPCYFSLLTTEQITEAKTYLLDLWKRLQSAKGTPTPTVVAEESGDSGPDCDGVSADEDEVDFRKHLEKQNQARKVVTAASTGRKDSGVNDVAIILENYDRTAEFIPVEADVMEYWKKRKLSDPVLYELAMIVLAIPATQVAVERLFSCLRFILRPQRFGLSASAVEDITFLHANPDMVREIAKEVMKPNGP
ncbi:Zinc finger BED domain-containing protein 4 [Frankliniella fusca]|uniref:Zinc finger BED domain-containing protein 4 n=1 Tax=Frankliniella fusca TaxID=407009 RepID=A0AAE1HIB8_9NEOP|nr:Zinc finger BED domain-containing protein 4 [Frankliniella fusca]